MFRAPCPEFSSSAPGSSRRASFSLLLLAGMVPALSGRVMRPVFFQNSVDARERARQTFLSWRAVKDGQRHSVSGADA
jgi:hypothetical protein